MNLKEAMKRIEALEAEVARLKAQPAQHHYHYYQQPLIGQPVQPTPWYSPGWPTWPEITCGAGTNSENVNTFKISASAPSY